MESMGLGAYVLDAATADPAQTCSALAGATENLDAVKRDMGEKLDSLREDAMLPGLLAQRIVSGA
jgi:hypothetical protein